MYATGSAIISAVTFNKKGSRLSGLGDLSGSIFLRVVQISSFILALKTKKASGEPA